jgi:O-antigen/teichoic acid export membrane protein
MLKMNEVRIGSILLTGGHIFQAGLAFAINIVLVRYITPSEFGWFAITFAEASLFYSVLSIRTNILVIRATELAFNDDLKDVYFNAALQETVLATVLISFWLLISGNLGIWQVLIVLTLAVRHWTILNKAYFERSMPYKKLTVIESGSAITGHLSALAVVLFGGGVIALIIREIVSTVSALYALFKVGGVTLRRIRLLSVEEYKTLYYQSRGIWLDGLLEGTFQRLTILIAGYMGGDAVAGILFQAQRLAGIPHQVLTPFVNRIVMNWFSRTEDAARREHGRNYAVIAILVPLTIAAFVTGLYAEQFVPWLLGDSWSAVSSMLVGLTGMIVFISPFEILRAYCVAIHHTRKVLIARIAQHIGLLVPIGMVPLGMITINAGLPIGLSIAYAAAFAVLVVLLYRHETTNIK